MFFELNRSKFKGLSFLFLSLFILVLSSCDKNDDGPILNNCGEEVQEGDPLTDCGFNYGYLVIHEGNFGDGTASVSHIDPINNNITNGIFSGQNSVPLGDVGQSIMLTDERAFIVVNNSSKIEVVNNKSFEKITTIEGLVSPRIIKKINSSKAYVSNLFTAEIQIVDLENYSIIGSIELPECGSFCWTEAIEIIGDYAFVSNMKNGTVDVINTQNDSFVQSITVGLDPGSMVVDKNNKLWVLSSGGSDFDPDWELPSLHEINPISFAINNSFVFEDINLYPQNLLINSEGDKLYYSQNAIYEMQIDDINLPTTPAAAENTNYYRLSINPANDHIFAAEVPGFTVSGLIHEFDPNWEIINSFSVGAAPTSVYFQ